MDTNCAPPLVERLLSSQAEIVVPSTKCIQLLRCEIDQFYEYNLQHIYNDIYKTNINNIALYMRKIKIKFPVLGLRDI